MSIVLAAVFASKQKVPPSLLPGEKVISEDPIVTPLKVADATSATARIAVTCCLRNPGVARLILIFLIPTDSPVRADRARHTRNTCPPPSPTLPSISIIIGNCAVIMKN
jgi:hypothetical protein